MFGDKVEYVGIRMLRLAREEDKGGTIWMNSKRTWSYPARDKDAEEDGDSKSVTTDGCLSYRSATLVACLKEEKVKKN